MSAQTLNALVKGLETAWLLCRSRHPTHGRIPCRIASYLV